MYIEGKTECVICKKVIHSKDCDSFGLPHFLNRDDPLWQFGEAMIHFDCYDNWEHRDEFEQKYEIWKQSHPDFKDTFVRPDEIQMKKEYDMKVKRLKEESKSFKGSNNNLLSPEEILILMDENNGKL